MIQRKFRSTTLWLSSALVACSLTLAACGEDEEAAETYPTCEASNYLSTSGLSVCIQYTGSKFTKSAEKDALKSSCANGSGTYDSSSTCGKKLDGVSRIGTCTYSDGKSDEYSVSLYYAQDMDTSTLETNCTDDGGTFSE